MPARGCVPRLRDRLSGVDSGGQAGGGQDYLDASGIRRLAVAEEFHGVRVRTVRDAPDGDGVSTRVNRSVVNCERLNDRVPEQERFDAQGRMVDRRSAGLTEEQAMAAMRGERHATNTARTPRHRGWTAGGRDPGP